MTIALAAACFALWATRSAAQQAVIEVPRKIVAELRAAEDEEEIWIEVNADGTAKNLTAEPLELNGDAEPELWVRAIGSPPCGAANCPNWMYRKIAGGYELLLAAASINRIEVQKSSTLGYRDVMTAMHGSAWESSLTLYKFDGKRYRRKACFERTYQYKDAKGELREWKKPRITKTECENEEDPAGASPHPPGAR
ncbi:MAG TPA: hypothetical protein VN851_29345 [Thermoanaerobaculia bacterium]|nr:hypothetical protein [Thermoanaerobaculia bacterium]